MAKSKVQQKNFLKMEQLLQLPNMEEDMYNDKKR